MAGWSFCLSLRSRPRTSPSQLLQSFLAPKLYLLQILAYSILWIWQIGTQDITEKGGSYSLKGFPFSLYLSKYQSQTRVSLEFWIHSSITQLGRKIGPTSSELLILFFSLNSRWYLSVCYISHVYVPTCVCACVCVCVCVCVGSCLVHLQPLPTSSLACMCHCDLLHV